MAVKANFSKRVRNNFAWIPNDILNNEQLSLKAKGLWIYLNSKPENWIFSSERISSQTKDGVDGVKSALRELSIAGLLKFYRQKNGHMLYVLFDEPQVENPSEGKSLSGKIPPRENPSEGKSTCISKTDLVSKKDTNSKKDITTNVVIDESSFGNKNINEAFEKFQQTFGYSMKNSTANRRAVYNFIRSKDKGVVWLDNMIKLWFASRNDRYSPRIADFSELQQKYPQLLEWGQRQHQKTLSNGIINLNEM